MNKTQIVVLREKGAGDMYKPRRTAARRRVCFIRKQPFTFRMSYGRYIDAGIKSRLSVVINYCTIKLYNYMLLHSVCRVI